MDRDTVHDHEVSPERADDRAAVANEKDRTGTWLDPGTLRVHGSYITDCRGTPIQPFPKGNDRTKRAFSRSACSPILCALLSVLLINPSRETLG